MLSLYKLEHFLGIKMKDLFWKSVCVFECVVCVYVCLSVLVRLSVCVGPSICPLSTMLVDRHPRSIRFMMPSSDTIVIYTIYSPYKRITVKLVTIPMSISNLCSLNNQLTMHCVWSSAQTSSTLQPWFSIIMNGFYSTTPSLTVST